MPKRSTLTFSSEDAPPAEEEPLHVYYCKYSGQHCFITGALRDSVCSERECQRYRGVQCRRCGGSLGFIGHTRVAANSVTQYATSARILCARSDVEHAAELCLTLVDEPPPADASLSSLPRRRTDGSYILDTKKYIVRMSLNEQAPKLIKRPVATAYHGNPAYDTTLRTVFLAPNLPIPG